MNRWAVVAAIGLGAGLASTPASAQLLRYTYDEASGAALDSGSGTPADATLQGGTTRTTNTPSGTGFALDLITNEATGGYAHAKTAGDVAKLDGLSQFTLTTWINLTSGGSGSDRIMSKQAGGSFPGFMWNINNPVTGGTRANGDVNTGLFVGDAPFAFATSTANVNLLNKWVFMAVTYDGTSATNNTRFYFGSATTPVTQLGDPVTIAAGTVTDNASPFGIGFTDAAPTVDVSPDGYLDDSRVYGQALDLAALDAARLSNVPEPGSVTLLAAAAGLALATRRRRR